MIKIQKKDLIYSYLGYFIRLFSNIIMLPLVLNVITSEEFGLWTVFLAIGSFVIIFDMGFGQVIARYTTYAYCGAEEISKTGMPNINGNKTNYKLLFIIMFTARKIYRRIALLVMGVLILCTSYIYFICDSKVNHVIVLMAWGVYSLSVVLNMYFLYYTNFFKGLGKVKETQKILINNQIVYIILQVILLKLGLGLLGLGLSNLAVSIILRLQIAKEIKGIFIIGKEELNSARIEFKEQNSEVYNSIVYNAKGIGFILLTNFLQVQGNVVLCSVFLSLDVVARYGLTMQLIGIIDSFAAIPFNTYLPQMTQYRLAGNDEKLKDTFSIVTIFMILIFLFGSIFLLIFGHEALIILHSKTQILSLMQVLMLLVYNFIITNHQRCTNFISLGNDQSYVKAYIISSVLNFIVNIAVFLLGFGLWGIIIANIVIQMAYNGWRWPLKVTKIMGLSIDEMIVRFWHYRKNRGENSEG